MNGIPPSISFSFSPNSLLCSRSIGYGYRPRRSAQQAIQKVKEYGEEGYRYAVSVDLSKYFDTLNHEQLMNLLHKQIQDMRVSSTTTSPCTYAVEPPCTGRYARWCERSTLYSREPPTRFTKLVEVYHVQPRQSYPYQSFADDLPLREKIGNHNFLAHFLP